MILRFDHEVHVCMISTDWRNTLNWYNSTDTWTNAWQVFDASELHLNGAEQLFRVSSIGCRSKPFPEQQLGEILGTRCQTGGDSLSWTRANCRANHHRAYVDRFRWQECCRIRPTRYVLLNYICLKSTGKISSIKMEPIEQPEVSLISLFYIPPPASL